MLMLQCALSGDRSDIVTAEMVMQLEQKVIAKSVRPEKLLLKLLR